MRRKRLVFIVLAMVTMILCCTCLSACKKCEQHVGVGECTECGADYFTLLKKHCIKHGKYKSGTYSITYFPQESSTDTVFLLAYDISSDVISMFLQYKNSDIMIDMDEIDGVYNYLCTSTSGGSENTMKGTLNGSTLHQLSALPYTYSSASSYLNSALAKLACSLAQLLVPSADLYFIENDMPIRCVNLGFAE